LVSEESAVEAERAVLPVLRGETVLVDFFGVFAISRSPWSPALLFVRVPIRDTALRSDLV
jgi:hypothetical protein